MPCKNCSINPIIQLTNSNIKLCKSCFIRYFEKKAFKTIHQFNLIDKKDKIAVAISGGKDSLSVLNLLNKLAEKRMDIKLTAILIDEGIKGYRNETIKDAKKFCKKNNIKLNIYSFKEEFNYTLDEIKNKLKAKPCSVCGVFRRYLINKKARELKVNKIATGHNLDDEAQAVLMNQFKNNIQVSARLGPITGIKRNPKFIPRIKPFYLLTEKEVMTYAYLNRLTGKYLECPYESESFRCDVRDFLNDFEQKYPGTKHSIISSFLEILPLLKTKYESSKIKICKSCSEPTSSEVCTACEIRKKLNNR